MNIIDILKQNKENRITLWDILFGHNKTVIRRDISIERFKNFNIASKEQLGINDVNIIKNKDSFPHRAEIGQLISINGIVYKFTGIPIPIDLTYKWVDLADNALQITATFDSICEGKLAHFYINYKPEYTNKIGFTPTTTLFTENWELIQTVRVAKGKASIQYTPSLFPSILEGQGVVEQDDFDFTIGLITTGEAVFDNFTIPDTLTYKWLTQDSLIIETTLAVQNNEHYRAVFYKTKNIENLPYVSTVAEMSPSPNDWEYLCSTWFENGKASLSIDGGDDFGIGVYCHRVNYECSTIPCG